MKRRDLFKSAAAAGRGSVTEINKAAAVLAALLLGLFGIGRTATAQAQSMESATSTPAASRGQGNGPVWLRIMAFTDAPVAGADVRVSVNGSQGRPLVDVHAATNKYGVFPVQVQSHPSSFRVEISGGTTNGDPFFGHLSADVVLTDPAHQILVVNPVTTLVSLVLDKRPNLKLDGAQARVRTFLKLPVNYSLGLALRQGSRYASRFFSPVTFTKEVRDSGGLDVFEHLLLQELASDSATTHSFRQPKLLGDTDSTITSDFEAGLEAGVLDYAGANNVANLTGWAMGLSGLSSGGSSDEINAVLDELVQLQSEIEDLANQVAQLTTLVQSTATLTQYNTIVVPAQTLANEVNGVQNDLVYFANACPPVPDGSTPTTPSSYCTNEKVSINDELNEVTIQQAYVTLEGDVGDNPAIGFSGMLHLYSLWLGQSKPFFRAADSTKMQNLYNYWDSALAQAANLKVELLHENGAQDDPGGQQQLTDFMGNPDVHPSTTGTFQANQAANQKLMFPPVPEGTVISTVDHTMWSVVPYYPYRYDDQAGYIFFPVNPPDCLGGEFVHDPNNLLTDEYNYLTGQPYASFNLTPLTWSRAPSKSQWQAAVKLAPPLSSGTNWQQWLTQQTMTTGDESPASPGFFNSLSCTGVAAWTTTQDGSNYWTIHLDKDSFTTSGTGSNAHNFAWPVRQVGVYSGEQFVPEQYFWYN